MNPYNTSACGSGWRCSMIMNEDRFSRFKILCTTSISSRFFRRQHLSSAFFAVILIPCVLHRSPTGKNHENRKNNDGTTVRMRGSISADGVTVSALIRSHFPEPFTTKDISFGCPPKMVALLILSLPLTQTLSFQECRTA